MSVMASILAEVRTGTSTGTSQSTHPTEGRPGQMVAVRTKDLCMVTRQLATLLRAGMPLVPALSAMLEQLQGTGPAKATWRSGQERSLAGLIRQIRDRVNAGASLSAALADCPEVFGPLFVHTVAAGEAGGTLEEVLSRLADTLERRVRLQSQLKAALAYPIMMAIVAVAVVVFLLAYVVPGLTQLFVEMNRSLPWPTRWLISISGFLKQYWIGIWVSACVLVLGLSAAIRTRQGRTLFDQMQLSLPWIGPSVVKAEIARLARTLGTLLGSGVPVLRALDIAGRTLHNGRIKQAWTEVSDAVRTGDTLAHALRKTGLFPPLVYHVVATGERSGTVEQGLVQVAEMYDSDVQNTVKALASLVGFMVLAILLPIFDINQAL